MKRLKKRAIKERGNVINQRFGLAPDKILRFPEAKGKILEGVEFVTSADYNAVSLSTLTRTYWGERLEAA